MVSTTTSITSSFSSLQQRPWGNSSSIINNSSNSNSGSNDHHQQHHHHRDSTSSIHKNHPNYYNTSYPSLLSSSSLPSRPSLRNPHDDPSLASLTQDNEEEEEELLNNNLLPLTTPPLPPPLHPRRSWWVCLFLASFVSWGSALEVHQYQQAQQIFQLVMLQNNNNDNNNNNNNDNNNSNNNENNDNSDNDTTRSFNSSSSSTTTIAIYSITATFVLTFVYCIAVQLLLYYAPQQQQQQQHFVHHYYFHRIGSKIEFVLLLLLMGCVCTSVSTVTNPIYGLSINPISGEIRSGNLYYSVWTCAICLLALVQSYIRTEYGIDLLRDMKSSSTSRRSSSSSSSSSTSTSSSGKRLLLWIASVVTSLLVMASSATCYDAKCGNDGEEAYNGSNNNGGNGDNPAQVVYYDNGLMNMMIPWEEIRSEIYCHRAALGVSVGCIGCVTSLSIIAMRLTCSTTLSTTSVSPSPIVSGGDGEERKSNRIVFVVECLLSWILLCLNCFAVAYLTSEGGPGAPLGNLYFAAWMTLALMVFVALSCCGEVQLAKKIYKRRFNMRQDSSTENTMSEEGFGVEGMSSLNSSSNRYGRRLTDGSSLTGRFDGHDSEDAPSMFVRSTCSGSVAEVQVGD